MPNGIVQFLSRFHKSSLFAYSGWAVAAASCMFTVLPQIFVDASLNDFTITPPLSTDPNHAAHVFFTNVGPNTIEGVKVSLLATSITGEKSYAEDDVGIIGPKSRGGTDMLHVAGEPARSLICVSYKSGPFRRGWMLVLAKPSLTNFERRILLDVGNSYFSENPCKKAIMRAMAEGSLTGVSG